VTAPDGRDGWWLPTSWRSRRWTIRYAVGAYAASWAVVGAVSLITLPPALRLPPGAGALTIDAAWLTTLIPLYRAGSVRLEDLGIRSTSGARAVGLALLVFVATSVFDAIWAPAAGVRAFANPFSGVSHASAGAVAVASVSALVSPVAEEVFFRGLLYRCFRNRLAVAPASVLVGAMFALVHTEYSPAVLPELAVYGALLCLLYEHTGSLWPGIALDAFLDVGGLEQALTGMNTLAFAAVALVVVALIARAVSRR
jgi:membrane protease YdiL (CAAX protease family)